MREDMGTKAKELLEKIKEAGRDYWKKILDKLGNKDKREVDMHVEAILMQAEYVSFDSMPKVLD